MVARTPRGEIGPQVVDGARPAVELVTALPAKWFGSPGEHAVLMAVALDSFDGITSRASVDELAKWSHMWPSSVREIVRRLEKPNAVRPALLAVEVAVGKSVRN